MKVLKCFLSVSLCVALASEVSGRSVSTAFGNGADVEFRESQPTTARGTGSEIASRIASGSRNSNIYLRFDVSSITPVELLNDITVQTHIRNNNLSNGRIQDSVDPVNNPNAGFDYYVLDPTSTGNNFDEGLVDPVTASTTSMGYVLDGDFDTKPTGTPGAPSAGLTYLGTQRFRDLDVAGGESNLPIGEAFNFTLGPGSDLHTAIATAQTVGFEVVTLALAVNHETSSANGNWLNFNYLFSPKEWVADQGLDAGQIPSLELVPEPTSLALLALGSLAIACRRR